MATPLTRRRRRRCVDRPRERGARVRSYTQESYAVCRRRRRRQTNGPVILTVWLTLQTRDIVVSFFTDGGEN